MNKKSQRIISNISDKNNEYFMLKAWKHEYISHLTNLDE